MHIETSKIFSVFVDSLQTHDNKNFKYKTHTVMLLLFIPQKIGPLLTNKIFRDPPGKRCKVRLMRANHSNSLFNKQNECY